MALKGKDRLGKLIAVYPGGYHRKPDPAVDVHEGRSLALGPEGAAGQYPDLPFAGNAEGKIFSTAANTVHGDGKGQQFRRGGAEVVGNSRQQALIPTAVLCCQVRSREEIRIRRSWAHAGKAA
jgi:hypothetical protein